MVNLPTAPKILLTFEIMPLMAFFQILVSICQRRACARVHVTTNGKEISSHNQSWKQSDAIAKSFSEKTHKVTSIKDLTSKSFLQHRIAVAFNIMFIA